MNPPDCELVRVTDEAALQPGERIWWPMGPVRWGGMEYQPGCFIPSAVVFRGGQ